MNILTSKLPDSIMVDGKLYEINTDFKVWIEIENTFLNANLSLADRLSKMLRLCYKTLPPQLEAAVYGMMSFYSKSEKNEKNEKITNKNVKPVFNFDFDSDLIYSAFYSQYGIDLLSATLHWWQFLALFKGLDDENKICRIMGYRALDIEHIKSKETKKFYRKMKKLYALPDTRSESEKEHDMIFNLEKVF